MLAFVNSNATAQTIGDKLEFIKYVLPGGEMFDVGEASTSLYKVDTEGMVYAYVCDKEDNCISMLFYPKNPNALSDVKKELDKNWVKDQNSYTWILDRDDGEKLFVELLPTFKNGFVYVFRPYNLVREEKKVMEAIRSSLKIKK